MSLSRYPLAIERIGSNRACSHAPIIVVESVTKKETIAKFSGVEVFVISRRRDVFCKRGIGIDFGTYLPIIDYTDNITVDLIALSVKTTRRNVYLAFDPDREGFALATLVANFIKNNAAAIINVEIHDLSETGLREGLARAVLWDTVNHYNFESYLGRIVIDRLIPFPS